MGFPYGSAGQESACNAGDLGSIPGLGRSPGEGKGYPLQYSGLENSMNCIVLGVTKSRTRLSDFHVTSFHFRDEVSQNEEGLSNQYYEERKAGMLKTGRLGEDCRAISKCLKTLCREC